MANSLAHTKWICKYHIVFTPKYRNKIICEEWKEIEIMEGHIIPDHVYVFKYTAQILCIPVQRVRKYDDDIGQAHKHKIQVWK